MLEEDAMFKMELPEQLTPTWKMLLLSDGSVTRHLQLLTGRHIEVVTATDLPRSYNDYLVCRTSLVQGQWGARHVNFSCL